MDGCLYGHARLLEGIVEYDMSTSDIIHSELLSNSQHAMQLLCQVSTQCQKVHTTHKIAVMRSHRWPQFREMNVFIYYFLFTSFIDPPPKKQGTWKEGLTILNSSHIQNWQLIIQFPQQLCMHTKKKYLQEMIKICDIKMFENYSYWVKSTLSVYKVHHRCPGSTGMRS